MLTALLFPLVAVSYPPPTDGGGDPNDPKPPFVLSTPNPPTWNGFPVTGVTTPANCPDGPPPPPGSPARRYTHIPVGPDRQFTKRFDITEHVEYRVGSKEDSASWSIEKRPPYLHEGWNNTPVMFSEDYRVYFNPDMTGHPDWTKKFDVPTRSKPDEPDIQCDTVVGPDNGYEGEEVCRVGLYSAAEYVSIQRPTRIHAIMTDSDGATRLRACVGCEGVIKIKVLKIAPGIKFHEPYEPREWEPREPSLADFCSE